jgi:glycosyltransferase involved in cell wall biosynthesis
MRIGFISTRLAGTDGVSLETAKWVTVLERLSCESIFFAGESEWPEDLSYVIPEAHFNHPEIRSINNDLFQEHQRLPDTSLRVTRLRDYLKAHLISFINHFDVQVLIVENALALPMNIPLGLAITELVAETSIPTIAHHHDFTWERERYAVARAADYLRAAFPPTLEQIEHVVINSYAEHQLALNAGVSSTVIPNVMDFEHPPPEIDEYGLSFRSELGLREDQCLLLQPTRIIPRKRIEKSIELARRLGKECVLLITHDAGDEGQDYKDYLQDYASLMGVNMLLAADRCAPYRSCHPDGRRVFNLSDIYQSADLVSYPSQIEGFGNALLEAIYFKRPILTSAYRILKTDIQPKGFRFIEFDEYFRAGFVEQVEGILNNPASATDLLEQNYEIGRRHYSYSVLEESLERLLRREAPIMSQPA